MAEMSQWNIEYHGRMIGSFGLQYPVHGPCSPGGGWVSARSWNALTSIITHAHGITVTA
jgi:hypothetical protein